MHIDIINQLEHGSQHLAIMAHRGSFKCITKDTNILLANGIEKKLSELMNYKNTPILNYNPINGKLEKDILESVNYNGFINCYELTLQNGDTIQCTKNHPFYSASGWKELSDLKKGDFVAVPRKLPVCNNTNFTNNEMRFFGYLIGDGGLTGHNCIFTNIDFKINLDFNNIIKELGGSTTIHPNDIITKSVIGNNIKINKRIRTWLRELGFNGSSYTKLIPNLVLLQSNDLISELLKGYFSANGTVMKQQGVSITSVNKKLLQQVKLLLLRFGIISTIKYYSYQHKFYRLYIYGKEQINKFIKIGFIGDKSKKLKNLTNFYKDKKINLNNDIVPFVSLGIKNNTSYKGITFNGTYGTSRKKVNELYNKTNNKLYNLLSINDLFWTKIKSIKNLYKKDTYHLCVKKNKNFIGNGIISHNTYIMSRSFPLWVIYKEVIPKVIIIVSMNQTQSRRILGLIRDELKTNPHFSHFKFKTDSADMVEIYIPGSKYFHTVVSIPLGTRGPHGDYVISDDVMKDEEGRTTSSMSKLKETWFKAQFPMAMARGDDFTVKRDEDYKRKRGKHLFIGTPISFDDIFMDLKEIADEKGTWLFYRYPALKKDGTPQFPEHYSIEMLDEIKNSTTSWAWEQEYMLNPVGGDYAIFPLDLIESATTLEYKELTKDEKAMSSNYMGCDVAMSNKSTADNSAFVVLTKAPNHPIKVEDIWHEKGVEEDDQIKEIKSMKRIYHVQTGIIERKGLTYSMANKVVTDTELAGTFTEWNPTNEEKAKIIGNLQLLMKHKMLYIPKTLKKYDELVKELMSFALINDNGTQKYRALSGHDDLVIGLALAVSAAGGWVYEERPVYKLQII